MKGARIFLLLALAIVSLAALGAPRLSNAAPAHQLNVRVTMTVDAGFNSYVKERAWIPLRITLVNSGDPIEGEVVVTDARLDLAQRFSQSVSLPRGARRQATLYVPSTSDSFEVQLISNDTNAVVASVTPLFRQLAPTDRLVLIASDPPDGFNFIGDVRTPSGSTSALALLRLDQIPDRTAALDAADVIVLNSVDSSALTRAQRDAITQWVATGGHLILSGGPNAQLAVAGFADVAPGRVGQTLANASAGDLGTLAAPLSFDSSQPSQTVSLSLALSETLAVPRLQPSVPNVRALAGSNETPLILRRDFGRGIIDQLAFDPSLAPLRDWSGRAAVFAWLMGGRVGQANDIGAIVDGADASYAAGALAAASPPSALVVGGFFALYVILIGPINFLVLRRFRKQPWAWVTIPALVIGFTVLGLLTGFRLRGNNPQMHRLTATLGDAASGPARSWGIYGLYSPRRTDVEVDVNRALAQLIGTEHDPEQTQTTVPIVIGDPSRIEKIPLSNNEVRTVYSRDGGSVGVINSTLAFVPGSANTAAAIAGDIRNDTGFPLQGCALIVGKDYQSIGELAVGGTAKVKINLIGGHTQTSMSLHGINDIRDRFAAGRGFSYSNVPRAARPSSSSAAAANTSASSERFPFEQNGPPTTDAMVNWQVMNDALRQDAQFGLVATVFGGDSIGSGAYVSCWELRDTSAAQIATADYTDRAVRVWRVPVQAHLTQPGESLPPDAFSWNIVATNTTSELNDNGLVLEPGSHIFAITPWFDIRTGSQTPLVALNLTFDSSGSFTSALAQTTIWLYDWRAQKYVQIVKAADDLAAQNVAAGPYVSPAGQIFMRIDSATESITLNRVATSVEMGK